jgi:CTP synthase
MAIEFARSVLGLAAANSEEFDCKAAHPAVVHMPETSKTVMGGTMRLGLRRTLLEPGASLAARLYNSKGSVDERHRHRYEVNPSLVHDLEAKVRVPCSAWVLPAC